jgi:hypothetical protein
VGLTVGFIIYYGGRSIKDLKIFFVLSTVALFFIAAGQVRILVYVSPVACYLYVGLSLPEVCVQLLVVWL